MSTNHQTKALPLKHSVARATKRLICSNRASAQARWGDLSQAALTSLAQLTADHLLSVPSGDLLILEGRWYVTHSGLLRIARRARCSGISVQPVPEFSDPRAGRWAFKATVYRTRNCKGFVGFGDADPSNVSPVVRGAEMRVAETRAVNRALRKAFGIGICSVEEIGSFAGPIERSANVRKLPPQPANGNGGPRLRDQLCLLIRQHRLDASLVKLYAADFCGTENLRQASREQVESFIKNLAESAAKDHDGLLCKLNSYSQKPQEGAA
jgi:hypothetical protein